MNGDRLLPRENAYLAKAGSKKSGKSESGRPPAQPPKNLVTRVTRCPECGSSRIWKDGLRYARTETGKIPIQRFLCRSCGRRFSETANLQVKVDIPRQLSILSKPVKNLRKLNPVHITSADKGLEDLAFTVSKDVASHDFTVVGKGINTLLHNSRERQVCATENVAKNLSQQLPRQKRAAGATTPDIKGKLVEYMWYLKRNGYADSTTKQRTKLLKRLVKRGAELYDPEQVKQVLAEQENWSDGYKKNFKNAYAKFVDMEGLSWQPPKYKPQQKLPFIPLEKELDQLIAATGKKVSIFLEGLKQTGADPGELLRVEWTDVNRETRTVTINHPVKGHNPRILPVSKHWVERVQLLLKESERIWSVTMRGMYNNFWWQRKRVAKDLNNPRLEKITFTTFRHWKATTEYHKTRDLLHVKHLLGHKNVQNTMIYIDIERAIYGSLKDEEFTCRIAKNLEDDKKLIEAGFEYVTDRDGVKIYRKRK